LLPPESFDLKSFKLLAEHKKMLFAKIKLLSEFSDLIKNLVNDGLAIIKIAEVIRILTLKFSATKKLSILVDIRKHLSELMQAEKLYMKNLHAHLIKLANNERNRKSLIDDLPQYFVI
jgi:hypothetical protein